MLKLSVCGQNISCEYSPAASDSIDYLRAAFSFSPDWFGLTKTAQFTQNGTTYNAVLEQDQCTLPAEITAGAVEISVFGQKSDSAMRITTLSCSVNIRASGFHAEGETPIPPTPDLYSQLIGRVEEAVEKIPENLSEFTDDVGYAKISDIPKVPSNISAFTNDAGYAKTSDIPKVPSNISAFTNDAGYAKTSDIPQVPTKLSQLQSDLTEITIGDFCISSQNGTTAFSSGALGSSVHYGGYYVSVYGFSVDISSAYATSVKNLCEPENDTDAATKGYVDKAVGDVEKALDMLIAIQQNLINGGASL